MFYASLRVEFGLTISKEHKLTMSECTCQQEMLVTGGWRALNGELRTSYSSPNITREMKSRRKGWEKRGTACVGEMRNAYEILVGESEE